MFESFSEHGRQVVVLAQQEARSDVLRHNYIGTEHLLLGMLDQPGDPTAQALAGLGVSAPAVRERVVALVGRGEDVATGQIPFTPRAKKVLEEALRERLELGHREIETGHLMLALVKLDEGVGARVLLELGVAPDAVREAVLATLPPRGDSGIGPPITAIRGMGNPQQPAGPPPLAGLLPPGAAPRFTVEPDPGVRRLLMAAGALALADGREAYSLDDLLEALASTGPGAARLRELGIDPAALHAGLERRREAPEDR